MFYEPVQSERHYERDFRYSDINWKSFPDTVDAFQLRMQGWYIEPVEVLLERGLSNEVKQEVRRITGRQEGGHYSFTVMAMTCMLIDTLSQFRFGEFSSEGRHFKKFVKDHLPTYSGTMLVSIWHFDHPRYPRGKELKEYAEVLWNGFRCGILHQAHAPLYCGVVPGTDPPKVEATNHAKYASGAVNVTPGADCPVLVICPEHLFNEVMAFFGSYLRDLKDRAPQHDPLRDNFKKKFSDSFGIDLSTSTF